MTRFIAYNSLRRYQIATFLTESQNRNKLSASVIIRPTTIVSCDGQIGISIGYSTDQQCATQTCIGYVVFAGTLSVGVVYWFLYRANYYFYPLTLNQPLNITSQKTFGLFYFWELSSYFLTDSCLCLPLKFKLSIYFEVSYIWSTMEN